MRNNPKRSAPFLWVVILWISLFFAPGAPCAASPGERGEVLVTYYLHRPPYYVRLEGGGATGLLVEMTKMVFDAANIPHRFVEMPPKRILSHIQQMEYSCSVGWFKTKEREGFALFSEPIYQDRPIGIVMPKSKVSLLPERPSLRQIMESPLTLGIVSGFSYGRPIDDYLLQYKPPTYSLSGEPQNLLKMMAKQRIDYAFMAPEEAVYLFQQDPLLDSTLQLVEISDVPPGNLRYLMFSRGLDPALVERVNSAIRVVVGSEKYMDLTSLAYSYGVP